MNQGGRAFCTTELPKKKIIKLKSFINSFYIKLKGQPPRHPWRPRGDFKSGRKSPWGHCLTRLVPNGRSNWRLRLRSFLCALKSNPYTVVKSFTIRRANVAENVKFVDDLHQALRESLAVFPVSGEQNLNKNFLSRTLWEGGLFFRTVTDGVWKELHFFNCCHFPVARHTCVARATK